VSTHNLEFLKYLKKLSAHKKDIEQFMVVVGGNLISAYNIVHPPTGLPSFSPLRSSKQQYPSQSIGV
jgi:hypothetical protein